VGYPDPETFHRGRALLGNWLDALLAEHGVGVDRLVLGGFSQGAVMSYAVGLGRGRPRPAALIALSGFVPTVPGFELDLESPLPPIAIGHGSYDDVIGPEWGRHARELLEAHGAGVLYAESPLPHTIDPRFVMRLRPWLFEALGAPNYAGGRSSGG
jgi:phospholipase/carboxylesterase